jgi:hypothetical protein
MTTVRKIDVTVISGLRPPKMTTAHDHVGRFYHGLIKPPRPASVLEQIQRAPNEVVLEAVMAGVVSVAGYANRRTWRNWLRAVRTRVLQLREQNGG